MLELSCFFKDSFFGVHILATCFALTAILLVRILKNSSASIKYAILNIFSILIIITIISKSLSFSFNFRLISTGGGESVTVYEELFIPIEEESGLEFNNAVAMNKMNARTAIILINIVLFLLSFSHYIYSLFYIYKLKRKSKKFYFRSDKLRDLLGTVKVLQSGVLHSPLTVGFFDPVIILPKSASAWAVDDLEHVLIHEYAHIKRNDFIAHAYHHIIYSFFIYNPVIHLFYRMIKLETERACDSMVIKSGKNAESYASCLLTMAKSNYYKKMEYHMQGFIKKKDLEKRICSILNKSEKVEETSGLKRMFLYLFLLLLFGPLTAMNPFYLLQNDKLVPGINPLKNYKYVSFEFGKSSKIYKKKHKGIDLAAKKGANVYASADGYVNFAKDKGAYGLLIELTHDLNGAGEGYQTRYAHLDEILVKEGQKVKQGDLIAKVGSTGKSTGPHLHYEVLKNGKQVDPSLYMNLD